MLGDVVAGFYYGVPYEGLVTSRDGLGRLTVEFPEPHKPITVYGSVRELVFIDLAVNQRPVLVSRPEVPPQTRVAHNGDGEYLVRD